MHWSVVILHAANPESVPVLVRRSLLVAGDVLVVPEASLTSSGARTKLGGLGEAHILATNPSVFVVSARDESLPAPDVRGYWRWRDLWFFLGGTLVFLLVLAVLVLRWGAGATAELLRTEPLLGDHAGDQWG